MSNPPSSSTYYSPEMQVDLEVLPEALEGGSGATRNDQSSLSTDVPHAKTTVKSVCQPFHFES